MAINISSSGSSFPAGIRRFLANVKRQADTQINQVAEEILTEAKSKVPVLTGDLQKSLKKTRIASRLLPSYTVGTNVIYAWRIEFASWSRKAPNGFLRLSAVAVANRRNARVTTQVVSEAPFKRGS